MNDQIIQSMVPSMKVSITNSGQNMKKTILNMIWGINITSKSRKSTKTMGKRNLTWSWNQGIQIQLMKTTSNWILTSIPIHMLWILETTQELICTIQVKAINRKLRNILLSPQWWRRIQHRDTCKYQARKTAFPCKFLRKSRKARSSKSQTIVINHNTKANTSIKYSLKSRRWDWIMVRALPTVNHMTNQPLDRWL